MMYELVSTLQDIYNQIRLAKDSSVLLLERYRTTYACDGSEDSYVAMTILSESIMKSKRNENTWLAVRAQYICLLHQHFFIHTGVTIPRLQPTSSTTPSYLGFITIRGTLADHTFCFNTLTVCGTITHGYFNFLEHRQRRSQANNTQILWRDGVVHEGGKVQVPANIGMPER